MTQPNGPQRSPDPLPHCRYWWHCRTRPGRAGCEVAWPALRRSSWDLWRCRPGSPTLL